MMNTDDRINVAILVIVAVAMALIVPARLQEHRDAGQWIGIERGWGK